MLIFSCCLVFFSLFLGQSDGFLFNKIIDPELNGIFKSEPLSDVGHLIDDILEHTINDNGDKPCIKYAFSKYRIVCRCNSTYCDTINPVVVLPGGKYVMYSTDRNGARFHKTIGEFVKDKNTSEGISISINKSDKRQKMFGFGGAFTDSAGINILSLSKAAQDYLIDSYYSTEGIEYNFGRVPIGGCDFSVRPYELDDSPGDTLLQNFSLAYEDYNFKIPLMKRCKEKSKRHIYFLGSAWSAPPWMKTNNNITAGFLKTEYYQVFASYHLKFLEEYKKEGITFWGLTTGNEPTIALLPIPFETNSMAWLPTIQAKWIAENLGPTIRKSEFAETKIICLDDQRFLLPVWVDQIFANKEAKKYIDGIGLHWYFDQFVPPEVIKNVNNNYPEKFIMNTEASQGAQQQQKVIPGSWERGETYVTDIMQDLHSGMIGWLEWNLALNMTGGPNWVNNFVDPPILVNKENDEFYKQPMFYSIGHFSKFITPGAVKIGISPKKTTDLSAFAVLNEDGSIAVILQNRGSAGVKVHIDDNDKGTAIIFLEARSVNTIVYSN